MATLPAHHPHLAIHLTDRALTPIISSSTPSSPTPPASKKPSSAPFSTSPLSSSSSSSSLSSTDNHPTAAPLTTLSHTALTSYATAKRLARGAPLRTLVEYPHAGPVVLHSYLCPMALALGIPGGGGGGGTRRGSLTTAAGEEEEEEGEGVEEEGNGAPAASAVKGQDTMLASGPRAQGDGIADEDDDDDDEEEEEEDDDPDGPNAPPMLIATVVAPAARDLKEARRAAGRLEKIARSVQMEWVAEGPGT